MWAKGIRSITVAVLLVVRDQYGSQIIQNRDSYGADSFDSYKADRQLAG